MREPFGNRAGEGKGEGEVKDGEEHGSDRQPGQQGRAAHRAEAFEGVAHERPGVGARLCCHRQPEQHQPEQEAGQQAGRPDQEQVFGVQQPCQRPSGEAPDDVRAR